MFGMAGIYNLIEMAAFILLVWSLIHVVRTRPDAYVAVGKQTKKFWTLMLGIPLILTSLDIGLLRIVGLIAALIYVLDVRPAIDEILRRRN